IPVMTLLSFLAWRQALRSLFCFGRREPRHSVNFTAAPPDCKLPHPAPPRDRGAKRPCPLLSRRSVPLFAPSASTARPLARAQPAPQTRAGGASAQPTLLRIERRSMEVNGKSASVLGIRQPDGTFGIRTQVGDRFRVRVENTLEEPSLIHWHGLTPPWQQ